MASVTLSLAEFEKLKADAAAAEAHARDLETKLAAAQLADPSGRISDLVGMVYAAKRVIQFAVGNLAPEAVRGWPYADLSLFAQGLTKLPGAHTNDKELAHVFLTFIEDAQFVEEERRRRDAAKRNNVPTITEALATEDKP